jgi:hypothetical protein
VTFARSGYVVAKMGEALRGDPGGDPSIAQAGDAVEGRGAVATDQYRDRAARRAWPRVHRGNSPEFSVELDGRFLG